MKKKKKIKNALKHGVAEKFEQLQLRFELNFIREAEGVVVREWAAIQQVKDHLNGPLRLCLLQSELIVPEIFGQWRLDTFVHSLKALIEFLKSMTDMALARVDKISRAELALLGATPEERKQVLNAVHQLAESSTESSIILQQIIRLASDLLMRFLQTLP